MYFSQHALAVLEEAENSHTTVLVVTVSLTGARSGTGPWLFAATQDTPPV